MNTEEKELDNQSPIDFIYGALTEEEKQFLEKINTKVVAQLEKIKATKYDHLNQDSSEVIDFADKHPEVIHKKHLSLAPHEITVYVKAEVSEIDNKGYLSEIKDIFEKYYHIPVEPKADYRIYVEKFFDKFHNALEKSCQEVQKEKRQQ